MSALPPFLEVDQYEGSDYTERWGKYIEGIYQVYLRTVAYGNLVFRGLRVRCQFRPETFGKHYAFWHLMQQGEIEDDRVPDLQRCRRVGWIGWVVQNAARDNQIRVFPQHRGREESWVLWLHEQDYAVVLWTRRDYYLLKTAFLVKPHKNMEFGRDWNEHTKTQTG